MKILIITTVFPYFDIEKESSPTKFLYYYAAEWIKQGHEVLILHSERCYPQIFSKSMNILSKCLGSRFLPIGRFRQDPRAVQPAVYEIDGIRVIRIPIRKLIPHRDFLPWDLARHRKDVLVQYKESGFVADFIISDYLTPSLYIADDIRRNDGIPFFQILHQTDFNYLRQTKSLRSLLTQAAGILYRSYSHVKRLSTAGISADYQDFMFTGIPNNTKIGTSRKKVRKLLFVGVLIPRKRIDVILEAIAMSRGRSHYEFEIVGDGPSEKSLKTLVNKLGLQNQVIFSGRMSREQVFEKMRQVDCFIMVSVDTFGMVYIEALSQGCIVIAAKDQGVDGIVVNGENGYLVELDNVKALTNLLDQLWTLDDSQVRRVSENGLQTAKQMTDGKLAEDLLERLCDYLAQIN